MKRAIGIDIGTTTICGLVIDGTTGEVLKSITNENDSFIKSKEVFEKIQDSKKIVNKIGEMLQELMEKYSPIESIGITGQMHGVLYVDQEGEAVSPLYTWQDGRGDLTYEEIEKKDRESPETYAGYLSKVTGYQVSTGFGITTHFYNMKNGLVPTNAKYLCTIGDYVAMKLSNQKIPVISPSNGASLGCFDLENQKFDRDALEIAQIDKNFLPEVKSGFYIVGDTKEGIPVSVAIGDNQGSVLGSVQDLNTTVLVNIGTGSQISVGTKNYNVQKGIELRPLLEEQHMLVGSSLCGGRAYAMLENFFKEVVYMATGEKVSSLYEAMENTLAWNSYYKEEKLVVVPRFSGTREQPLERGKIENISIHNFTPGNMIDGMLQGIASELFGLYEIMYECRKEGAGTLVGSGNGIRRNKYLQKIFEDFFKMELKIPVHKEEAAYGTALFSLVACGVYSSMEEAAKIIRYEE